MVSESHGSEEEEENKGWRPIKIRTPKKLRNDYGDITANQQIKQNNVVLGKGRESKEQNKGWKVISMIDPKMLKNKAKSTTTSTDESHQDQQNRKRRIRRKRIKRKRRKKHRHKKRKHKKKGCRKKVKVNGKRICVKRPCTVAWCKNRKLGSNPGTSPHKNNFRGNVVTPI